MKLFETLIGIGIVDNYLCVNIITWVFFSYYEPAA